MGNTGEKSDKGPGPEDSPEVEVPAEDLLALTEGVELTVELEPATGSRLKGSYWIATIPSLGVTASALGLEATLGLGELLHDGRDGHAAREARPFPEAARVAGRKRDILIVGNHGAGLDDLPGEEIGRAHQHAEASR